MSELVKVTLPDGSQKEAARGISVLDFVKLHIGAGLAKAAYIARLDGQPVDLARTIDADARLEVVTTKSPEALEVARHDAAHVMASVVQQLFPGTQVTIGPSIEDGFYYDFAREKPFTPEDLAQIEAATNEAIKADHPFVREEVSMEAGAPALRGAGREVQGRDHPRHRRQGGDDADPLPPRRLGRLLPRAARPVDRPHRRGQADLGGRRLLARRLAQRQMLQRIYGTAFFDKKALDAHLHRLEEAKKRDHRKLGPGARPLRLPRVRPGLALLAAGRHHALQRARGGHAPRWSTANGYQEIKTPLLFNKRLWEQSGHWGKYKENMFLVLDSESDETCARRALQLLAQAHELPVAPPDLQDGAAQLPRAAAPLLHHRRAAPERGLGLAVGGLTRVRQFEQDDSHIYLMESQIADEVQRIVDADEDRLRDLRAASSRSSSPPGRRPGGAHRRRRAVGQGRGGAARGARGDRAALRAQARRRRLLRPQDRLRRDRLDRAGSGRPGTIQLDYAAPERFDLTYVGRRQRRAPARW